jgi:ABC-2 type transport system ATP-binding protein
VERLKENIILDIKNITKNYGKKVVLDNVFMKLEKGEIIGIVGPNGAGKTTLMKIIVGLIKEYKGEIYFNKTKIRVGAMIESPKFYNNLSGLDNLKYFSYFIEKIPKEKILDIVDKIGLKNDIKRKVKTYSMGMKQRLGIALTLINDPDILILDEPLNGLDPKGVHEIRNYLMELNNTDNTTILVSSHILSEIEKVSNKVLFIKNGVIVDEVKDLNKKNINLEERFLKIMED